MKELKSKSLLIYDPETGEKKEIDIFRGESAYEAAVRLGMTTLSEEQWVREYDANRDAAIAAIEAKAKEALASIPEDYTQLGERVDQLSEEIADIGYSSVTNLIDPSAFTADSYWAGYANTVTASGYASISIPVKAGVSYSCSGQIDKNWSWFHAPGIEYYALTSSGATIDYGSSGVFCRLENFIPKNDGYLRVTSRNNYVNIICLVNDEVIPTVYSEYGEVRKRKLGDQVVGNVVEHTVVVAKDGSGDYTTIKEAAAFAKDYANTTIIVEAGTYDIIEEMGADYFDAFTSSTSENSGIILTNGVHLIFRSNAFVVCNYTGGNDYVKKKFSPFVVDKGQHTGFTIENMHLSASNVRYCVHDDTGAQKTPYRNVYRNCHMYIDNTANTAWTAEACIGGGTGCGTEVLIENCYFDCGVTSGWNPKVVNYHNCATTYSPCRSNIIVKDCYFAGVTTCGCSHYGDHDELSRMIVCGCSMAVAPSMRFEDSATYPNENFELIAWNNEVRS